MDNLLHHCSLRWCLFYCSCLHLKDSLRNVFAKQLSTDPLPLSHLVSPRSHIRDFLGHHWAIQLLHLFPQWLVDPFPGSLQFLHQAHVVRCFSGCGLWAPCPCLFVEFTMTYMIPKAERNLSVLFFWSLGPDQPSVLLGLVWALA